MNFTQTISVRCDNPQALVEPQQMRATAVDQAQPYLLGARVAGQHVL